MAGKHVGGADSRYFIDTGLTVGGGGVWHSDDKTYAEARTAYVNGVLRTENPFGTAQEAAAQGQSVARAVWDHSWVVIDTATGFQLETATVDP